MKQRSSGNLFKRLYRNTIYSFHGLKAMILEEKSIILVGLFCLTSFAIAIFLQVSFEVYFILGICFLGLLAFELINTAIENTVDLVTDKYHELAKKAKDQGSASTAVVVIIIILIMMYLFYPYIMKVLPIS